MGRFSNRSRFLLNKNFYRKTLKKKDRASLVYYGSVTVPEITTSLIRLLTLDNHVWSVGDNYYKLAEQKYGDKDYWWVIAWYNNKPSDTLLMVGDVITIPYPVETLVSYYYNNT